MLEASRECDLAVTAKSAWISFLTTVYINLNKILVKTWGQNTYIVCEQSDLWQQDLDDDSETWGNVDRTDMTMIRWMLMMLWEKAYRIVGIWTSECGD